MSLIITPSAALLHLLEFSTGEAHRLNAHFLELERKRLDLGQDEVSCFCGVEYRRQRNSAAKKKPQKYH